MRQEKIDILALQGIVRTPGLKTRTDVLDGLSDRAEFYKSFGQTISVSGRQDGNAVLSTYPIRSDNNFSYEGIRSTKLEAALQAVIDGGLRDLIVVSTQLPGSPFEGDLPACIGQLSSLTADYPDNPVIIAGNLPASDTFHVPPPFQAVRMDRPASAGTIWYGGPGLRLLGQKTVSTEIGTIVVARFGIYRKPGR